MTRTSKATGITLAVALLAELSLSRALVGSDVIAAILGAELFVPGGVLALYAARLVLLVTLAVGSYRFSSWACRRGAPAS